MPEPDAVPSRKVTAAALAAIVMTAGGLTCDLLWIEVPATLTAVLTGLVVTAMAYLVEERPTGGGAHRQQE